MKKTRKFGFLIVISMFVSLLTLLSACDSGLQSRLDQVEGELKQKESELEAKQREIASLKEEIKNLEQKNVQDSQSNKNGIFRKGDAYFYLVNETDRNISSFYVSPKDSSSWKDDILGKDILTPGEKAKIRINDGRQDCFYDFRATLGPSQDGTTGSGDMINSSVNVCDLKEWGFK